MQWKDEYAPGIFVVDSQHKQRFRLCNELDEILKSGVNPDIIDVMLVHLGKYAVRHFAMEEKYMRDEEHPGLEEHPETYRGLAARFKEMSAEFQASELSQTLVDNLNNELTCGAVLRCK